MGYTIIEKILLAHSDIKEVKPGDIIDVHIDVRAARDFGGANVISHLEKCGLDVEDAQKTCFTFDCNPGGSDQKYAANQHRCRNYARQRNIPIYDIPCGIGTHVAIDNELVLPGNTFVSTDSHANIMGAIGAFGQGMGDQDIAAAWANGKVWFKAPASVKIVLRNKPGPGVLAKDITLHLLKKFGANALLGYVVEIYGECVDEMPLADRITIASMATEMGAIAILFDPNSDVLAHFKSARPSFARFAADADADYRHTFYVDVNEAVPYISRPGHPEDVAPVVSLHGTKIDSAFIGSCTNGCHEDMKIAAQVLSGKKVAPGVVLKIVPATESVWDRCLEDGLLKIFREAGALVGNPGCAGCADGQIGQNGPREVTVSTGNRNFAGKQGGGFVYLASPATAAASAVAGFITTADNIPRDPAVFVPAAPPPKKQAGRETVALRPLSVKGRAWLIDHDNIDTDMIYHNRHLAIVDINEMGQYALGNLEGWKDFAKNARPGDIVFAGKNFGCGSSRQQAVDCFVSLQIGAIVAESFGAIYERNAINAAFPILALKHSLLDLGIRSGDVIELDFVSGEITRESDGAKFFANPFFPVQLEIYRRGGLLKKL